MAVEVLRFSDAKSVAQGTAKSALELIATLQRTQETVHLMVTGGTVGILTLAEMLELANTSAVDFKRIDWWWGDERFVESTSPDRNENQARDALLNHIEIDEARVHSFASSDNGLTLAQAVQQFEIEISKVTGSAKVLPKFDLVFLGMGPDGHIASLFPGKPAIEPGVLVLAEADSPKPPPERLTFSYEALNQADRIWFTIAGADKANAVASAFSDDKISLPVDRVEGRLSTIWFVDEAASGLI
jgi:6-phosphogluconolactonase